MLDCDIASLCVTLRLGGLSDRSQSLTPCGSDRGATSDRDAYSLSCSWSLTLSLVECATGLTARPPPSPP